MSIILRIGGVPEHFSEHIYQLLAEQNSFGELCFEWIDYPTGTGAMVADLLAGKLDLAIALTEGLVYAMSKNQQAENRFKIIHPFVNSSIIWGVHCAISQENITPNDMIAISRIGSGSHIMSLVYAHQKSWKTSEEQFLAVGNLLGGIEALENGKAQRFMWEKFMTKPYIDAKKVKRVDECPTPWASFMMVCNDIIASIYKNDILNFLEKLREKSISFQNDKTNIQKIAKKFNLIEKDVINWWQNTIWATNNFVLEKDILLICGLLNEIGLFSAENLPDASQFINTNFCQLKK